MNLQPQLVSLRTLSGRENEYFDWHDHPFFEFTLVTDGEAEIAYPPGWRPTPPQTLYFYRPGESHGARVPKRQGPHFWVVHLDLDPQTMEAFPSLAEADPRKRHWRLTEDQVNTFRWLFYQMANERNSTQVLQEESTSAWLQVLLISIERWRTKNRGPELSAVVRANPEVRKLWHAINDFASRPKAEWNNIFAISNYDSVRHAFRRTFGCSPREMLIRLRMEHARNLLLESNLSIKEISDRVGYARQHEFYRAFRRHTGCSPSQWRENPFNRRREAGDGSAPDPDKS